MFLQIHETTPACQFRKHIPPHQVWQEREKLEYVCIKSRFMLSEESRLIICQLFPDDWACTSELIRTHIHGFLLRILRSTDTHLAHCSHQWRPHLIVYSSSLYGIRKISQLDSYYCLLINVWDSSSVTLLQYRNEKMLKQIDFHNFKNGTCWFRSMFSTIAVWSWLFKLWIFVLIIILHM